MELKKKLHALHKDALIDIILELERENEKAISIMVKAHNPKELYAALSKEISAVKSGKRFVPRGAAFAFTQNLNSIVDKIDKYLAQDSPDLAIKLCKRLLELNENLCNRVDDSNGCLRPLYDAIFTTLDKAFACSKKPPKEIADYLLSSYLNDQFGTHEECFNEMHLCLSEEVLQSIESALPEPSASPEDTKEQSRNRKILEVHKAIADKRSDVDRYIAVCRCDTLHAGNAIDIAKRLHAASRTSEAIEWLNTISDTFYNRDELLIEYHLAEGNHAQAKEIIWHAFSTTLSFDRYTDYLELANDEEKKRAKAEALHIARNASATESLPLLQKLGEYNEVAKRYFELEDTIDGSLYFIYRPLSNELHKDGNSLIATLLRRKLVESVLEEARSTSYKYAASDLKIAADFAEEVDDWKGHPTHAEYLNQLKNNHKRKTAFWPLVDKKLK